MSKRCCECTVERICCDWSDEKAYCKEHCPNLADHGLTKRFGYPTSGGCKCATEVNVIISRKYADLLTFQDDNIPYNYTVYILDCLECGRIHMRCKGDG